MRKTVKDLKLGDELYYLNQTSKSIVTSLALSGTNISVNGRVALPDGEQAGAGYYINEEDIIDNRILMLETNMKSHASNIINSENAIKKYEELIKEAGAKLKELKKNYKK